ncbi:MAG: imidazole glycerol phosphate synthase subunit HisH [Alphaproteobacteria bacterium]
MTARSVVVVPTGTANLASVRAAFERLGRRVGLTAAPDVILAADHVLLPGVGAFGPAMETLARSGADAALKRRIEADRPTLAICVGHQLLFATSDESPGVRGLAVVDAHVGRFGEGVRRPQFGWNEITPAGEARFLRPGFAYFANGYRATAAPGWTVATAEHGGRFVASMEKGRVVGCQFHPELSGDYGKALLEAWLSC